MGTDFLMRELIGDLYDEHILDKFKQRGFDSSPSMLFTRKFGEAPDYEPIIKYAKEHGYDSLRFIDESFDTYVRDTTYMIFDGSKVKITGVFDVVDAVESNYSKEPVRIK